MEPHQPDSAARYLEPYRQAIARHGPSFEATLWMNPQAQIRRFDIIVEMIDPTGLRLIDAGCARGELGRHLAALGKAPAAYIGLDALPEFIRAARSDPIEGLPEVVFDTADFVADTSVFGTYVPDLTVFSGSLNTLAREQALDVVGRAYDQSRVGVVFNFLSTRHHPRYSALDTGPANRYDPTKVVAWALDMTPKVRFRQDYFDGHDATVAMFKLDD
ncbi:MAG: class I SAM-dependent methyltransferase [Phycisphaerales bacterium]|nr:class I SAM-dependent methyltransferase [Phycisphaerales bacterium]